MKMIVDPKAVFSSQLISERTWPDFERMFARHKGCHGGCWCMYHILSSGEFTRTDGETHKIMHRDMILDGKTAGVICYLDETPVGWCQFGPAANFEQINRSKAYRQYRETDSTQPVWRITCVFVDKAWRGQGLARLVLHEAVLAIRALGGGLTEAFPMEVPGEKRPQYTGSVDMYEKEGFTCIAPLGKSHYLLRADLNP